MKTPIKLVIILTIIAGICFFTAQLHHIINQDSEIAKVIYMVGAKSGIFESVNTGGNKLVALTFDDGPDPTFTPQVLDTLAKYDIKATFFVVGQQAEKYPELVERAVKEGFEIENHTYSHPDLTEYNEDQTSEEILTTQSIIERLTNRRPHFFRPPKKLYKPETIELVQNKGYNTILWTICIENQRSKTIDDMANRIVDASCPGIIILGHDGRLDRTRTVKALPQIIEGYKQKGYKFVTLDQMFAAQKSY